MGKLSFPKRFCTVLVFCVAAAIVSPAQTLTTLYSFCSQANCTDGIWPHAGLVQGTDGNFYGTTTSYGANGDGTVFKITPSGTLITLHSFAGADGENSMAELMQGFDGNFYGTTFDGGANDDPSCVFGGYVGCGTVFKITPGGSLSTLYNFCSQAHCFDGSNPDASLVQGSDGNLYGTTSGGGTSCCGTVFKITPDGTLATLYSFCSLQNCADGEFPRSLVRGTDGNFYGTTNAGGTSNNCQSPSNGCGTVFKITPQGMLTTLHSFDDTDGCYPQAGLVQGTDGNFYGTTSQGGIGGYCGITGGSGTIFKITAGGILTTLYSFCSKANCADGMLPYGALVQATDGNFYGTTNGGGDGNCGGCGTVFTITPGGALTTLHSFCSLANCADGVLPYGTLVQATDGTFHGTTYEGGGTHDAGTVFNLDVGIVLSPVQFVPVTPCRLVDTRKVSGGSGPIPGGTFEVFILPQLAKSKGCDDLLLAQAYSVNVTVVPQGPLGYLTVWPAGRNQPNVSTLNSADGRVKANAAIVPAGASQAISVFASNTTDVVIDIDGYFTPAAFQFFTLPPCRVADTRKNNFPQGLGAPHLSGGMPRDFPLLSSTCNIPSSALAYSLNFTAVPYPSLGDPLGYLEVWPTGEEPQNPVSTLNNPMGTIVANAAIVPAGSGSEVTVLASDNTDLVIDINGYFAVPGSGGLSLYPVVPCRVIDTRKGNGAFMGELTVNVVGSPCAPPSTTQAYVFNATVVPPGSLGYLTLWPDCPTCNQPLVSTLNALDGAITSNMAIVPKSDGSTDAFASNLTQLILDISSYFAP